jgi:tyrosinase
MTLLKRRFFLTGAATIPFTLWFDKYARAQAPLVRHDARSPQGQAMLRVYAAAVRRMQTTARYPEANPLSWTFQWYTHFVRGSTTKSAELARIYPSPTPRRTLANETWNTCQSHSGQPEEYFLPWHRMYVYFFEQIIRNVSGNPTFTLPYWNSTRSGSSYGVIPPEFTRLGDPTFGALYMARRNPGVNEGRAIAAPGVLNLDALSQCAYRPSGALAGFNQTLDFGLHGNVHVGVGNTTNMGAVPWAAGDPVFWLHHCMIDRLWASWNAAGRANPTDSAFLNKTFIFADGNGNRVVTRIADVLAISRLGYAYDRLESVPACPPSRRSPLPTAISTIGQGAPLTLGAAPARATMDLVPPSVPRGDVPPARTVAARMAAVDPKRSVFLVLRRLRADLQPGTLFNVFLALPEGLAPEGGQEHLVGTINFFAAGHGDHGGEDHGTGDKFVSFDITALAARLRARNLLNTDKLAVTFAPVGAPVAGAQPLVGALAIVEQ